MTPRSPPALGEALAIASAASRIMLKVPIAFTVSTLTKRPRACGASLPSVRSAMPMPAQLTSTWRPPNSFTANATAALPSASEVTSVLAKRPPSSFASFSPASACRSAMTTLPPPSAAMRAVAAPRPEAPPVMRNTLFLICIRCSPAEYGYSLRKNADLEDNSTCMRLAFDLSFADLYPCEGLQRFDAAFLAFLREANDGLHARVLAARGNFAQLKARE